MSLLLQLLDKLSRYVAGFVGVVSLLGQAFAGAFSLGGTLAGVGGLCAAGLAPMASRARVRTLVLAACAAGVLGAALHIYEYYSTPHVPGNYYAWFITAPFVVALLWIAVRATRT